MTDHANGGRTLVIGVGNTLRGDDGVGVHVARELARRPLPEGVEALDGGTQGLDLIFRLEEADRVILIDAAKSPSDVFAQIRRVLERRVIGRR